MAESPFCVLIVDDEPGARKMVLSFLQESFPEISIAGEASSVKEASELIPRVQPDLLFLDVEMQDGTGFDLLDRLPVLNFNVIFITAHNEFAIKAFKYNAIDYLLKPINPDEFIMAVRKSREFKNKDILPQQLGQLLQTTKQKSFEHITLNTSNGYVFAKTNEITRIETYGNYCFVYLKEGERILVPLNLKEFEEMLPEPDFFRLHQSHIVNTAMVRKIIKEDGDLVIMSDGSKIPIARRRKDDFLKIILRDIH